MNALVDNLLDMARLEAGAVPLRRDWQPLEEVVGSALAACAPTLQGRPIQRDAWPTTCRCCSWTRCCSSGCSSTCWRTPPSTRRPAAPSTSTAVATARHGDDPCRRPRTRTAAGSGGHAVRQVRARRKGERHAGRRPGAGHLACHRAGAPGPHPCREPAARRRSDRRALHHRTAAWRTSRGRWQRRREPPRMCRWNCAPSSWSSRTSPTSVASCAWRWSPRAHDVHEAGTLQRGLIEAGTAGPTWWCSTSACPTATAST